MLSSEQTTEHQLALLAPGRRSSQLFHRSCCAFLSPLQQRAQVTFKNLSSFYTKVLDTHTLNMYKPSPPPAVGWAG